MNLSLMRYAKKQALVILGLGSVLFSYNSWAADPGAPMTSINPDAKHGVWVVDNIFNNKATLLDADTSKVMAFLSGGFRLSHILPLYSPAVDEIYVVETHLSRTWHGERTDIVAIYDRHTLASLGEIAIPPKHAFYPPHQAGSSALSDDGRFLAAFNLTPATSVSIVDVRARKFITEVSTPGCSMVFAGGDRKFGMLCGDGSMLVLTLSEDGSEVTHKRSKPFFDPNKDPVTEKGVRHGNSWAFMSYDGYVHDVNIGGRKPTASRPWSVFTDAERAEGWAMGGKQHLAFHERTGRLYSIKHKGGRAWGHKDPGTEVWVYDFKTKKRVQRIKVPAEDGIEMIAVTQDANPVLLMAGGFFQPTSVHNALTGEHLRDMGKVSFLQNWIHIP